MSVCDSLISQSGTIPGTPKKFTLVYTLEVTRRSRIIKKRLRKDYKMVVKRFLSNPDIIILL